MQRITRLEIRLPDDFACLFSCLLLLSACRFVNDVICVFPDDLHVVSSVFLHACLRSLVAFFFLLMT